LSVQQVPKSSRCYVLIAFRANNEQIWNNYLFFKIQPRLAKLSCANRTIWWK
jgi:hypothetical protein